MYPITLNLEDVKICIEQGQARNSTKKDQSYSRGHTSEEKHIMGMIGEYACEKYLGAIIDWELYGRLGDKGRPDCTLPDGRKAQIKSVGSIRTLNVCYPVIQMIKTNPNDLCIALQVIASDLSKTAFIGYLTVGEFGEFGRSNDEWYLKSNRPVDSLWAVPKTKFRPIEDLIR